MVKTTLRIGASILHVIYVGLGMISKWREGWSHGREGVEYGLHGKLVSVANSEG